jgi:nucleoside-diphosphate-sugar epimerase
MKVFVAGGSGTIGVPLVRALVAAGHEVTALTRRPENREQLARLGASVAVADALDRRALVDVVREAQPTHVVHQLTALPKNGPRRTRDLDATNRLRTEGTRYLIEAAVAAGARRLVAGSFALLSPRGAAATNDAAAAVHSMERQVIEASARGAIEGIVLRYGLFYGAEAPSTAAMLDLVRKRRLPVVRNDSGQLPLIQLDDAVEATVRALSAGRPGGAYDVVDDRAVSFSEIVTALAAASGSPAPMRVPGWLPRLVSPYMARMMSMRMPLSNAAAKTELGWRPRYSTIDDGIASLFRRAA